MTLIDFKEALLIVFVGGVLFGSLLGVLIYLICDAVEQRKR